MKSELYSIDVDSQSNETPHDAMAHFEMAMQEVTEAIAPVWPLKDYVAVNPYFGLAHRSFMSARAFLRVFSDCETLMSLDYYASRVARGQLEKRDVEEALAEIDWPGTIEAPSADEILEMLAQSTGDSARPAHVGGEPAIRTIAKHASSVSDIAWSEIVLDEISKFCAAHYDDDQAAWSSPWKCLPLYQAWREMAQIDRNAEMLGLAGMRKLVASLPTNPKAAIVDLLTRLQIPYQLWSTVLLGQAFSMPGWSAWAKYQDAKQSQGMEPNALTGLVAMRLAYDYAIGQQLSLHVDWNSYLRHGCVYIQGEDSEAARNAWIRYALLRATEVRYRRTLLGSLNLNTTQTVANQVAAQMIFCIDVRSERIRRQIEAVTSQIQTFGFAGFFGVPMEYLPLGESNPTAQLPVLLEPQLRVNETLAEPSVAEEGAFLYRRVTKRSWRKLWHGFKSSSIGSFGFVESTGLLAGYKLVRQSLGLHRSQTHQADGCASGCSHLRPSIVEPSIVEPSIDESSGGEARQQQELEIAARALRNMSLTENFARLVIFCGHHSQTNNNPLAASLDCGACGGHSGAPNARWLALLLNQAHVRSGLLKQGIHVPDETRFVAAVHNTTTDQIQFFDVDQLPASHVADLAVVQQACSEASGAAAVERLPQLGGQRPQDVDRRAADWSEVRPEWGLSGNCAMIVGPRSLTQNANLSGRVFLHSYEAAADTSGAVLETIMTAPMIVANWINMQYYASTVDNNCFGSGSKAVHNVVGKFGILSGNSGDLKTGLPWQSLHDGTEYQHHPLRLLVVICAPRAAIQRIYEKHELVANLVNNEWLSIVAVEDAQAYQLTCEGVWRECDLP